jgi:hypothetical protein
LTNCCCLGSSRARFLASIREDADNIFAVLFV